MTPLSVDTWTNRRITATVPAVTTSGPVVRDPRRNGAVNELAVSVEVGNCTNDLFVATTGDNTTGDGTASAPYQTIQHAIDQATAGDRIFVAAGTYNEQVILYKEVALLGSGAGTVINSRPATQALNQVWKNKLTPSAELPTQISKCLVSWSLNLSALDIRRLPPALLTSSSTALRSTAVRSVVESTCSTTAITPKSATTGLPATRVCSVAGSRSASRHNQCRQHRRPYPRQPGRQELRRQWRRGCRPVCRIRQLPGREQRHPGQLKPRQRCGHQPCRDQ